MTSLSGMTNPMGATGYKAGKAPSGYKTGQLQNFTPEQMQLFQSLFSNAGPNSYLSKLAGGDQSTFDQMEAPALNQFSSLMGGLSSRFSGGGGGRGALSSRMSSGFQNAAYGASSDFAQQLQSQRQGLQRQALMDLMGISGNLLQQRPYENFLVPKQQSFLEQLAPGIGQGIGMGGALGLKAGLGF